MDDDWIITAFVLIDPLMEHMGHQSDVRAQVPDSEVILILQRGVEGGSLSKLPFAV